MISLDAFLQLPKEDIAELVKASGSKVLVFPINGTRRWFTMEYGSRQFEDPVAAYMDIAGKRQIEIYRLCFDHGINTFITPVIGAEILETRDGYMQTIGERGLARFVTHPDFLSFYEEYNVRVRFYGEYKQRLRQTPYEGLIDLFNMIGETTRKNDGVRLFYGAFADDLSSTDVIAEMAIEYYTSRGKSPTRKELVELYYGEYIEKADIFIGFDRFSTFDYPLLGWGGEDLYFTLSPSPYIDQIQLRKILYDHLYTRRTSDPDYLSMSAVELQAIGAYYQKQKGRVLGTGNLLHGIWIPEIS